MAPHYAELNENNEVIYVAYMDNEIITDENGNEVEELGIQHLHTHHGEERNRSLTAQASAADNIAIVCSYEEIS